MRDIVISLHIMTGVWRMGTVWTELRDLWDTKPISRHSQVNFFMCKKIRSATALAECTHLSVKYAYFPLAPLSVGDESFCQKEVKFV